MSIFRSERMSLWQMILQNESVYNCVAALGELGIVEIRDVSYFYFFTLINNIISSNCYSISIVEITVECGTDGLSADLFPGNQTL